MGKWLASFAALVGLAFLTAPSFAQIKYSQRGFFLVDYKVGTNASKGDRDFRRDESIDFGTIRGRFWNDFRFGEWARATWMFEGDLRLGIVGGKTGSGQVNTDPFDPRGDIVNIETGELFLDVKVPFTDFRFRGGQLPFFTILPVLQDRTPGFHLYRDAGWIRPNVFFEPLKKTSRGAVADFQGGDDHAAGAWIDILPAQAIKVRPFYFFRSFNNESFTDPNDGTTRLFDEDLFWLGLDTDYTSPNWFGTYLVTLNWGEREYDLQAAGIRTDQTHFGWESQFQAGYRWGANSLSFNYMFRSGNKPRHSSFIRGAVDRGLPSGVTGPATITGTTRPILSGKTTNFERIVTFFANKVEVSQLLTTKFQHPAFDLEISDHGGPANQTDAGWNSWALWYERKLTQMTNLELGFSVITTDRKTDNDGDLKGDSRHVGEAFDIIFRYLPAKGLSFNTGTAWLIPGNALDRPKPTGGSRDAQFVWTYFISTIWTF